jgi:hypothetical protein
VSRFQCDHEVREVHAVAVCVCVCVRAAATKAGRFTLVKLLKGRGRGAREKGEEEVKRGWKDFDEHKEEVDLGRDLRRSKRERLHTVAGLHTGCPPYTHAQEAGTHADTAHSTQHTAQARHHTTTTKPHIISIRRHGPFIPLLPVAGREGGTALQAVLLLEVLIAVAGGACRAAGQHTASHGTAGSDRRGDTGIGVILACMHALCCPQAAASCQP